MLEPVDAAFVDLAGGGIERDEDVLAGLVAGGLDAFDQDLERRFVGRQVRREATLVTDRGGEAVAAQDLLQRVEDLGADAQAFGKAGSAGRHHHEFLEVDRVVGVGTTVQHVHHRHRQQVRFARAVDVAEVGVKRPVFEQRAGTGCGQRDTEDGVGAEATLVLGPVEFDHQFVEAGLVGRVEAGKRLLDLAVDVGDRFADALAEVLGAAVTKLNRLEFTGRGARRHGGAADLALHQPHIDLDRGVTSGIEDLTRMNRFDSTHQAGV